jgi:hypothetical protein
MTNNRCYIFSATNLPKGQWHTLSILRSYWDTLYLPGPLKYAASKLQKLWISLSYLTLCQLLLLFLLRRYNFREVLAFSMNSFHLGQFLMQSSQFVIFIFVISLFTLIQQQIIFWFDEIRWDEWHDMKWDEITGSCTVNTKWGSMELWTYFKVLAMPVG